MMSAHQTFFYARQFYDLARKGENAGFQACLLNTNGNREALNELAAAGFDEVIRAALPPEQHKIGYLATKPQ